MLAFEVGTGWWLSRSLLGRLVSLWRDVWWARSHLIHRDLLVHVIVLCPVRKQLTQHFKPLTRANRCSGLNRLYCLHLNKGCRSEQEGHFAVDWACVFVAWTFAPRDTEDCEAGGLPWVEVLSSRPLIRLEINSRSVFRGGGVHTSLRVSFATFVAWECWISWLR